MSASSSLSVSSRVCSSVPRRVVRIDRRVLRALVESAGGSADETEIVGVVAWGEEDSLGVGNSIIVLDLRKWCRKGLSSTETVASSSCCSLLWTGSSGAFLDWLPDGPAPGVDSNLPFSSISWLRSCPRRQSPSSRGGIFSFPRPK